jgi:hypothetical protein
MLDFGALVEVASLIPYVHIRRAGKIVLTPGRGFGRLARALSSVRRLHRGSFT